MPYNFKEGKRVLHAAAAFTGSGGKSGLHRAGRWRKFQWVRTQGKCHRNIPPDTHSQAETHKIIRPGRVVASFNQLVSAG
ncbi:MAG: hypothetical protein XD80_0441 [Synergistales bacterium 53_16]|nr:MAG: hypothetical protein XD80_0441 [Synergistales bacterium 53_16]MDK2845764.1 hypothetical protein [Synergistales bacterium]